LGRHVSGASGCLKLPRTAWPGSTSFSSQEPRFGFPLRSPNHLSVIPRDLGPRNMAVKAWRAGNEYRGRIGMKFEKRGVGFRNPDALDTAIAAAGKSLELFSTRRGARTPQRAGFCNQISKIRQHESGCSFASLGAGVIGHPV